MIIISYMSPLFLQTALKTNVSYEFDAAGTPETGLEAFACQVQAIPGFARTRTL